MRLIRNRDFQGRRIPSFGVGMFSALGPNAEFTVETQTPPAEQQIQFTDLSTGNPVTWYWEKNDGGGWVDFEQELTGQNPRESFMAGTWSIRLTVTNSVGSNTETKTDYIITTP